MLKVNLPTLQELSLAPEEAFKNDALKMILNHEPIPKFLKKHPVHGNTYLPIDKVEFFLDRIFQKWRIEVLREGQMFNSVFATVRVHYKDPVSGEWEFHDGVGAKGLQMNKGTKDITDMSSIKIGAVEMALPIAKSAAIKDACDHIGKLFGRDLNRKDAVAFSGAYSTPPPPPPAAATPDATYTAQPVEPNEEYQEFQQPQQSAQGSSFEDMSQMEF